ncbi:MAG: non-canonical purine NTP pyrophosphatase [Candidatus Calescibacterium sp.]|jgi:XTP/dITP diphosphohydrolase|nr:non-canonical purine NTP pyrophosphatase [Candidatus Calescibacterium sp.]
MLEIFVATQNIGKQKEIREILKIISKDIKREIIPIFPSEKEKVPEEGKTYFENAYSKAIWWIENKKVNIPVLSEDSGLEIFALGKYPGVASSIVPHRDSTDKDRCLFILQKMKGISKRDARYVSWVVLVLPQEKYWIADYGETYGIIIDELRGENGFGYDPIFFSNDLQKTFGEAKPEEKNLVSHRMRAISKLKKVFEKL